MYVVISFVSYWVVRPFLMVRCISVVFYVVMYVCRFVFICLFYVGRSFFIYVFTHCVIPLVRGVDLYLFSSFVT